MFKRIFKRINQYLFLDFLLSLIINKKGRNGSKAEKQDENTFPTNSEGESICSSCKSSTAKFRCSSCKLVNYCSRECQRNDWSKHKRKCYTATTKV